MSQTIQIRPVSRELAKFVIMLSSLTGDGKTYSALQLALGLSGNDPSKIGLLDCENRRGSLYSNIFGQKKFLIGDLIPPFSPARYIDAMREFAEAGIEVLIIDSISHEVEGEGGLDDIAHRPKADGSARHMADWITAKREHKKFLNTLLFLPMHVICCVRAREKTSFKNPKEPVSLGIQPICEKNFAFEATFSFMLRNRGKNRDILKLNGDFEPLVGTDGYLTPEHGKNLRDWIGGFDPMERAKASLRLAASQGTEALKTAWGLIPKASQPSLVEFKNTLKDQAISSDSDKLLTPEDKAELDRQQAEGRIP